MKKLRLLGVIAVCLLSTSVFVAIPAFSAQIPIDKSTYYVATVGQPARMDPARAYDYASGELIQNVAQTLIWWNDKPVVNFTAGVGHNLTLSEYANLESYGPVLATALPTIVVNASGEYYTFTINTNAKFQPWKAGNGTIVPSRNLTAADVIYSFRRQMVYGSFYSPVWMWFTAAFLNCSAGSFSANYTGGPFFTDYNGTFLSPADSASAAGMIQSWCYAGPGSSDVSFHFENPWSSNILNQIYAQTWGSIIEPEWVQEHGGWNGQFPIGASASDMSADWTNLWYWKPTRTRSEVDQWKDPAVWGSVAGSKYVSTDPLAIKTIMGTGPYLFTSWDTVNRIWRIDAWNSTNAGDGSSYWANPTWAGNHILTVIWKGISSWQTRKMLFLEGEFDVCAVPRANMYDLLTSTYNPIAGINLVYNVAGLQNDVMLFCMNVQSSSPYQSYVGYPSHKTGAEQYFFNNTHLRRAFAWALNYTSYISDAWFGEANLERSWWVEGLSPQAYKNTNSSMPQRNLDLTQMQNELNAAVVDGYNVGTEGFEMTLAYNIGNDQRLIACNLIAQAFLSLGSKYKVNVIGLDWPVFLDAENNGYLPMYDVGWLADFADPDNLCEPYQASWGAFMASQGPPFPTDQTFVDTEIQAAMIEQNTTIRGEMYKDLQYRYWLDVPSFPLVQPSGRRFARDWVQGWYFNALYPGLYAYDLYKSGPTTYQPVDVDVTAVTPITAYPNVYISMGEMKQLYGGGAVAKMTFQVHVKRNDANTNVTLLTVAVGLERFNLTDLSLVVPAVYPSTPVYLASTIVNLAPGGEWTGTLTWYEDGKTSSCQANATWEIAAVVTVFAPTTAEDVNTANNFADSGFNSTAFTSWNATTTAYCSMPGDINGDGIVNILDSIVFMNSFGKSSGQPGYNQAADLNGDGTVDIFDAILFAQNLGKKIVSDP